MKKTVPILMAIFLAAALATPAGAQTRGPAAAAPALTVEAPANITVEGAPGRLDRRSGRLRGHGRLNQYRLRQGFGTPRSGAYPAFVSPFVGTYAYNPADPPRWHGTGNGWRDIQPRITVQHRRLFNPH